MTDQQSSQPTVDDGKATAQERQTDYDFTAGSNETSHSPARQLYNSTDPALIAENPALQAKNIGAAVAYWRDHVPASRVTMAHPTFDTTGTTLLQGDLAAWICKCPHFRALGLFPAPARLAGAPHLGTTPGWPIWQTETKSPEKFPALLRSYLERQESSVLTTQLSFLLFGMGYLFWGPSSPRAYGEVAHTLIAQRLQYAEQHMNTLLEQFG